MKLKAVFTEKDSPMYRYTVFLKWLAISIPVGLAVGIAGSLFHILLDKVTEFRQENSHVIFLLPIAGLLIVLLYKALDMDHDKGTNGIIMGARGEHEVSAKLAPLIVLSTLLTHLCGGSAGREGAALQLGGSLISPLSKWFRLDEEDTSMLIMCGMSAGFSALFGTYAAAAVFAIEVTIVGMTRYSAIVPCIISSLTAGMVANFFHVQPTAFMVRHIPEFDAASELVMVCTIIMGIACAVISIAFCKVITGVKGLYKKYFPNPYIRAVVGGVIVAAISYGIFLLTGKYDYNGAGTDIIKLAFQGGSRPEAFIIKLLLTALTLGAGFRGGEIVPSMFVGATFGCFFGNLLGLSPSFGAALGLAAVFCGVTNCPFASLILSVELFGEKGLPYYALAIGLSYMLSGYSGLYSAQKFMDNKYLHGGLSGILSYKELKEKLRRRSDEKITDRKE